MLIARPRQVLLSSSSLCLLLLLLTPFLHAKTVTLTASDDGVPLHLVVGDQVILELGAEEVPLAVRLGKTTVLSELGSPDSPHGDKQEFRFNALRPGEDRLEIDRAAPEKAGTRKAGARIAEEVFSVPVQVDSGEPEAASAQGSAHLLGVFAGNLPCADCSALRTRLSLFREGHGTQGNAGIYILVRTYVGAPHGDATFASRGTWKQVPGKGLGPGVSVIETDPGEPGMQFYRVAAGGGELMQLDREGKPIASPFNQTLKRVSSGSPIR